MSGRDSSFQPDLFGGPDVGHPCSLVAPALLEYRRQRERMVPVLRRVRMIRAGIRDLDLTDRNRELLDRILSRAETERNAGLAPLLAARAAWQGRQLEISGTQPLRVVRNRTLVDGVAPVPALGGAQ